MQGFSNEILSLSSSLNSDTLAIGSLNHQKYSIAIGQHATCDKDCQVQPLSIYIGDMNKTYNEIMIGQIDLQELVEKINNIEEMVNEMYYAPPGMGGPGYLKAQHSFNSKYVYCEICKMDGPKHEHI